MSANSRAFRHQGPRLTPRMLGVLLLVAGLAIMLTLMGCWTPQEKYKTLSFFFDGVPNPDAPAHVVKGAFAGSSGMVAVKRIVSQHKPYIDNQCSACHRSASGDIQEFELAFGACVKCHKKIATSKVLMHGPVAREQCKWCHTPHQSSEPALLRDTPINVCTQCHDKNLLGNTPPEHVDGTTSCLQCHFGHGGEHRNFLKPQVTPSTEPATAPKTDLSITPTTQMATQPATAPMKEPRP